MEWSASSGVCTHKIEENKRGGVLFVSVMMVLIGCHCGEGGVKFL